MADGVAAAAVVCAAVGSVVGPTGVPVVGAAAAVVVGAADCVAIGVVMVLSSVLQSVSLSAPYSAQQTVLLLGLPPALPPV